MLLAMLKLVAFPFPFSLAIDVEANGELGDADEGVYPMHESMLAGLSRVS